MKGAKQIGKHEFSDGITVRFFSDTKFKNFVYTINGKTSKLTDERAAQIKAYALYVISKIEEQEYATNI